VSLAATCTFKTSDQSWCSYRQSTLKTQSLKYLSLWTTVRLMSHLITGVAASEELSLTKGSATFRIRHEYVQIQMNPPRRYKKNVGVRERPVGLRSKPLTVLTTLGSPGVFTTSAFLVHYHCSLGYTLTPPILPFSVCANFFFHFCVREIKEVSQELKFQLYNKKWGALRPASSTRVRTRTVCVSRERKSRQSTPPNEVPGPRSRPAGSPPACVRTQLIHIQNPLLAKQHKDHKDEFPPMSKEGEVGRDGPTESRKLDANIIPNAS
jgi:hypothetical protein